MRKWQKSALSRLLKQPVGCLGFTKRWDRFFG